MSPLPYTHFYRYQTCQHLDRLEEIVLRHQLYFPTAAELNDPADCRPRLTASSPRELAQYLMRVWHRQHARATLDELVDESKRARASVDRYGMETILRKMTNMLYEEHVSRTRVLSMSKRPSNMSMWAKYAANHAGVCFEFENAGMFAVAQEVEYADSVPVDIAGTTDADAAHAAFKALLRKTRDWSNEDEVRLLGPTIAAPRVPYDPALLTRVILGTKIDPDVRVRICEWARRRVPPLTVVQARFDEFTHKLVFDPVNT